jgi:hypothetical protein
VGSLNAAIVPATSNVICSGVAGSYPDVLRCGTKAVADGFVSKSDPDHVHGDFRILIVEQVPSTPQQRDEAYVKFDLSDLPPYLLSSHARPVNASLWLFTELLTASQNATVQVHRVLSNDWVEATLTWNTKASYAPEYVSQQVRAMNAWNKWNVLSATQTAISNSSLLSFALTPSGTSPQNYVWFRSRDYSPQTGNLTTAPELDMDFIEPLVTILTPFPNIQVGVDKAVVQTDATGKIQTYLAWGEHQISLPEIVPIDEGARKAFSAWSDGAQQATRTIIVGNDLTLTAEYLTQYKLEASSQYGSVTGVGWYFENTTVTISASPTSLLADGILGYLGVRHVFDHWTGACTSSESQCAILINGPKSAVAQWRDDFTVPMVAVTLIFIGVILTALLRRRKGGKRPSKDALSIT